jgi:hypothetical protein
MAVTALVLYLGGLTVAFGVRVGGNLPHHRSAPQAAIPPDRAVDVASLQPAVCGDWWRKPATTSVRLPL